MKFETILQHCVELLKIVTKSKLAPDVIASEYFRHKKYFGSKERKIASEIVFLHLRFLGFSEYLFEKFNKSINNKNSENTAEKVLLTLFINIMLYPENLNLITQNIEKLYSIDNGKELLQKYIIDQIELNFNLVELKTNIKELDQFFQRFKKYPQQNTEAEDLTKLSARCSVQHFILSSWIKLYPLQGINPFEIAESLLFPSPLTIRINNNNFPRERILELLQSEGFECYNTSFSPYGITFPERVKLLQHPLYKNGIIEIQDEGSQFICLACKPRKGDKILDACAGAGGKSLFLSFLQGDNGFIVANDINILKLKELMKRANRAGFKSIKTNLLSTKKSKATLLRENYFDIVLVDAPCSGIGTSRRNPMHKWWITEQRLQKIARKQLELLSFYSKFVKQGGHLVYSTCSLMPDENQFVTSKFLEINNDFKPAPLIDAFDYFGISIPNLTENSFELNLFPHIHKTDGFYIAKFVKAT